MLNGLQTVERFAKSLDNEGYAVARSLLSDEEQKRGEPVPAVCVIEAIAKRISDCFVVSSVDRRSPVNRRKQRKDDLSLEAKAKDDV